MKLNKRKVGELRQMLDAAINWHLIFWMQDDQDLEPGFRRRELQRRKRWKSVLPYFDAIVREAGSKPVSRKPPDPGCCPSCGSGELDGRSFDHFGTHVEQVVSCNDCDARWTMRYRFDGFSIHE